MLWAVWYQEVSSVFLWFDREVLPGTLLLAAVIAAYFQLIYTISGESTRGTIVLLAVNVFRSWLPVL